MSTLKWARVSTVAIGADRALQVDTVSRLSGSIGNHEIQDTLRLLYTKRVSIKHKAVVVASSTLQHRLIPAIYPRPERLE